MELKGHLLYIFLISIVKRELAISTWTHIVVIKLARAIEHNLHKF